MLEAIISNARLLAERVMIEARDEHRPIQNGATSEGSTRRIGGKANQHLPGDEEVWLVGEHRASGERKYYLSNLPPKATLRRLASAIEARWVCEQAHQQVKEELASTTSRAGPGRGYTATR